MTAALDVPGWLWAATIGGLIGIIVLDLIIVDRRAHAFGPKEATRWVIFYVSLAAVFAVFVSWYFGLTYGGQFVAGQTGLAVAQRDHGVERHHASSPLAWRRCSQRSAGCICPASTTGWCS